MDRKEARGRNNLMPELRISRLEQMEISAIPYPSSGLSRLLTKQWVENKLRKAGFNLSDKVTWYDNWETYERVYTQ